MRRSCWSILLLLIALGAAPAAAQTAQNHYVVEDLGTLPGDSSSVAWGINANGDVVGWSAGPTGTRAFLYTTANGIVPLPAPPDRPNTVARDLNDGGVVVGSANKGGTDLGHAVVWSGGSVTDVGTLGTGYYSEATGVNNAGQVVGWSYTDFGSGLTGVHGFLYTAAAGMTDLTPDSDTGYAMDVNDAGQVTGYKTAFGGYHAFRWAPDGLTDLGVLPGFAHSFGFAINAAGRVAGSSSSGSGNSERFVRSNDGGGLQDLGGAGEYNAANGINAGGIVVGTRGSSAARGVVYGDVEGLRDLDALIDPSLGWVILSANDVNDAGQIAGRAFSNVTGQTHAVRLTPAAGPPPVCTVNCLRTTGITLSSEAVRRNWFNVRGRVVVRDENGVGEGRALVVARWTWPDGSHHDQNVFTNLRGVAVFGTEGRRGLYSLAIVNVVLSLHTFDPTQSVLTKSVNVR